MINYSFELDLAGALLKFEYHCNGELKIEFPVQDESFTCTPAQDAAIRRFRESFIEIVKSFGPENVEKIEIVKKITFV